MLHHSYRLIKYGRVLVANVHTHTHTHTHTISWATGCRVVCFFCLRHTYVLVMVDGRSGLHPPPKQKRGHPVGHNTQHLCRVGVRGGYWRGQVRTKRGRSRLSRGGTPSTKTMCVCVCVCVWVCVCVCVCARVRVCAAKKKKHPATSYPQKITCVCARTTLTAKNHCEG